MTADRLTRVKEMILEVERKSPSLARVLREDVWGHNGTWMVGSVNGVKEVGLPVRNWTQKYLTSLSLGPWRIPQQLHQKNLLLARVGDAEWSTLAPEAVSSLPFRLGWQRQQALTFHTNLRSLRWTLEALCARLRRLTGDGAYSVLATLSGVNGYSKCLDFFVREALRRDTVPVDRHVLRLLTRHRLADIPPAQLAFLIRQAGYEPRFVARALYQQGVQ
jgi:hypothetical protein